MKVIAINGSPRKEGNTRLLPVSYTHLDVYKRQLHAPVGCRFGHGHQFFLGDWQRRSTQPDEN